MTLSDDKSKTAILAMHAKAFIETNSQLSFVIDDQFMSLSRQKVDAQSIKESLDLLIRQFLLTRNLGSAIDRGLVR